MSSPRKKKSSGKRGQPPRLGEELKHLALQTQLALESERGCVVLGVSAIDDAMARLLWRYFWMSAAQQIEEEGAQRRGELGELEDLLRRLLVNGQLPLLRSFWARTTMSRVLGLLNAETYNLLLKLAEMRNDFAHKPFLVEINAENINSLSRCAGWVERVISIHDRADKWDEFLKHSDSKSFSEPRKQFMAICATTHEIIESSEVSLSLAAR